MAYATYFVFKKVREQKTDHFCKIESDIQGFIEKKESEIKQEISQGNINTNPNDLKPNTVAAKLDNLNNTLNQLVTQTKTMADKLGKNKYRYSTSIQRFGILGKTEKQEVKYKTPMERIKEQKSGSILSVEQVQILKAAETLWDFVAKNAPKTSEIDKGQSTPKLNPPPAIPRNSDKTPFLPKAYRVKTYLEEYFQATIGENPTEDIQKKFQTSVTELSFATNNLYIYMDKMDTVFEKILVQHFPELINNHYNYLVPKPQNI